MTLKKKRKRWNIYKHSRYKMVVYFKDKKGKRADGKDEPSNFYSFDWKSGYSRNLDPEKGLAGLHKKVQLYGEKANYILIYDRRTNTLIEKYFEGDPVAL